LLLRHESDVALSRLQSFQGHAVDRSYARELESTNLIAGAATPRRFFFREPVDIV
jgi:hypothetical protein